MKVELDVSSYTTTCYLKNAKGVDTSDFAENVDLVTLKANVDKLETDKLKELSV